MRFLPCLVGKESKRHRDGFRLLCSETAPRKPADPARIFWGPLQWGPLRFQADSISAPNKCSYFTTWPATLNVKYDVKWVRKLRDTPLSISLEWDKGHARYMEWSCISNQTVTYPVHRTPQWEMEDRYRSSRPQHLHTNHHFDKGCSNRD